MKKLLLIVAAACLTVALASCGAGDLSTSSAPPAGNEGAASQTSAPPADKTYSEDLKGLVEKLTDYGYLTAEGAPMRADFVGAFEGYRFINGNLSVELYQYDPNGLTEVSQKCIAEVKEKGQVTVLDTYEPVPAFLSANEKYLMFYKDNTTGADADARKAQAEEIVRAFQ